MTRKMKGHILLLLFGFVAVITAAPAKDDDNNEEVAEAEGDNDDDENDDDDEDDKEFVRAEQPEFRKLKVYTRTSSEYQRQHDRMDLPVVEVDGLNGAFYTAYMKANHDGFVTLVFDNNLEQEIRVAANEVRLPPPYNCTKDIVVGDEVEVLLSTSDQEPCGWWLAVVKMIYGQHYLIEYAVNGAVYHMFTKGEYIRCRNPNSPGTSLPSFCSSGPEKQSDTQDAVKQPEVAKPAEPKRKEVPKSTTGATPKNVTLKKDTAENGEVANRPQCEYKVFVHVKKHLMGLAIGTCGKILQNAKKVPGVTDVVLPRGSCTFTIYGKTPEAVQQAKAMLAYREACYQIPKELVGKIIGKQGAGLKEIVLSSGVVEITTNGRKTSSRLQDMVPFWIVGTEDKITAARALLEERVSYLQSTSETKSEYEEVFDVEKHLMGLAIGTCGKNLQNAKKVPGVTDVVLPRGSCTFTIYGKTPEAVQQAKAMLAFKEHCFYVPAEVVDKVVGKSYAALEEIVFNSGVQIRLDRNKTFPSVKGMVPFVVLGTEDKIKIACSQLEKRVTDFQAMERNM